MWTKPFILPDIFEGLALSKKLMDTKPEGYTTFEKFVEDIQDGKDPLKVSKKKKKKKEKGGPFLPQRELNLPPPQWKQEPQQQPNQGQGKGRGKKVKQYSYYGPGTERRVYGQGKATGLSYYGDGRDVYYPPGAQYQYGRGGNYRGQGRGNQRQMQDGSTTYGSTGRKLTGGVLQQEMFSMGDMQAALAYYEYNVQPRRKPLHQKN